MARKATHQAEPSVDANILGNANRDSLERIGSLVLQEFGSKTAIHFRCRFFDRRTGTTNCVYLCERDKPFVKSLPEMVAITGELRRALAIHEAGHTAAVIVLEHGKFYGAMIIDHTRNDSETVPGGGAYFEVPNVGYRTVQTYRDRIAVLLAGIAAEEVLLGAVSDGAGAGPNSDLAQATRIATMLQSGMGMGNRLRHSLAKSDRDLETLRLHDPGVAVWVDDVLRTEFERAKQIVRSHLKLVEAIADELEAKGKVSADQVAKMAAKLDALPRIATSA